MNAAHSRVWRGGLAPVAVWLLSPSSVMPSHALGLGWEGESGVFVTPLACTTSVENQKIHAVTAYHFLDAGPVIGDARRRNEL